MRSSQAVSAERRLNADATRDQRRGAPGPRDCQRGRRDDEGRMKDRAALSIALAAVACVLLALGGLLLYVKLEIGREQPFSGRLTSALDDPAVRGVAADRTVDGLISGSAADLLAVRPLLSVAVEALVGTASFKRVATIGVAHAHRELVTERGSVVVELERAGRLLVGSVRGVSRVVARRTSGDPHPLLTRVEHDNVVLRIVRRAIELSRWSLILLA